jgi:membrane protease subunit (stomatin/prohibitin family)
MKNSVIASKEVVFRGLAGDVIWKSDVSILTNTAKIYSRKDCDVVFLRKGAFMGAFNDREEFYLVDTAKQGFLSKLFHGEPTSDDCEIFYINRLAQLENKWGTPNRIDIYDKDYDMHTSVGANGSYKFSINSSMKLLSKIQGAAGSLSQDNVREFFRSELNMEIRNAVANVFYKNKYGLKDIATITTFEKNIAGDMKDILVPIFEDYGVSLDKFFISQFTYDDDFLVQMKEIKKTTILNKMKFDAEKEERKESKENFKLVTDAAERLQKSTPNKEVHIIHEQNGFKFCNECGHKNPANAKYCSSCGSKL